MSERVVPVDVGVVWDPNSEHGVLTADENGFTTLRLQARFDDTDPRDVVLSWHGAHASRIEPPNDEAISGHPLYPLGLGDVPWVGEVLESSLISELERRIRVHSLHDPHRYEGLRHWVVRLKGCVVEVVATSCETFREGGKDARA